MKLRRTLLLGLAVALAGAIAATVATGSSSSGLTNVAAANPKAQGLSQPNVLSPELAEVIAAQGSTTLDGGTADVPYYGYDGNGPFVPTSFDGLAATEAQKTEPDKNTYLVLPGQHGADASYDYGTHFLYQGHEATESGVGAAITRINLDADGAHRVTLLATQTQAGKPLRPIDGSTWDPWAQKLLFTTESDQSGTPPTPTPSVYQASADYPAKVDDISNVVGRGGFEGVQNDNKGNVYLVEDIGGVAGTGANAHTKQPNSFIYRFLPNDPSDLSKGGKVQALQVTVNGNPLVFSSTPDADINSPGYVALHRYGTTWPTKWLTIQTTTSATPLPGADDNALAKSAGATPFKRPENGVFRPGTHFTQFWFDETGDTDDRTCAGGGTSLQPECTSPKVSGGYGSVFELDQSPASDKGKISIFYNADADHSGFDNVAFFGRDQIAFVQDAGDTQHSQQNELDSAFMFDTTLDYSSPANAPVRFLAEGRDPSATLDSELTGTGNEGDNEITGIHVSDGDPSPDGVLGAKVPKPFQSHWRVFWTQQHGDNTTWEILPAPRG